MTYEEKIKIKYSTIHRTLIRENGRADRCSFPDCKNKDAKNFEWALKKGCTYSTDINNYIPLCVSCHRKYDMTEEMIRQNSISHQGKRNIWREVKVIQLDLRGNVIKEYDSVTQAAKSTGAHRSSISACLIKHKKTAGNYKWKYKNDSLN